MTERQRSRSETQGYRFPPPHKFPPVDECSRADLLVIAAKPGHEMLSAPQHVAAICQLVVELHGELEAERAKHAPAPVVAPARPRALSAIGAAFDERELAAIEAHAARGPFRASTDSE